MMMMMMTVNIDQFIFYSRQWQLYACYKLLKVFDHPDYSNRCKGGKALICLFVY